MRGDIVDTLTNLLVDRVKGKVPFFTRVAIETTGLADPAPILHTLMTDPIVAARYVLDGVVTTVRRGVRSAPNSGRERDSLIGAEISLIADLNSLQGCKKFPVRMRRELAHNALI